MKSLPSVEQQLQESLAVIRQHAGDRQPKIGLILGSGLGSYADQLTAAVKIPTGDIPYYPESTVEGHKGFLVFGESDGAAVLAVQGRTHFYEGHSIQKVAYVVRLMALLGVTDLIVTNAAGGANPTLNPGDLMTITDQINFIFRNPLTGPVVEGEERFPDMSTAFYPPYVELIEDCARDLKVPIKKGVLFVSSGPCYETAAEVRMIQRLGGDAASMSTVPEVIVAAARGIRVAGISCITNHGTGISATPLSHSEVTEIADRTRATFQSLLREVIKRINQD